MRIAVLTSSYPRQPDDDAGIFVARLVKAYNQLGHSGYVIVPHDGDEPLRAVADNFEIRRFKYGTFSAGRLAFGAGMMPNVRRNPLLLLQAPGLITQMAKTVLDQARDIAVMHANWTLPLLAAYRVNRKCQLPYIATVRGEDFRLLKNPVLRALLRPAYERASALTSVNQDFCSLLKQYFPSKAANIHFIPNGVELRQASDKEKSDFASKYQLPKAKLLMFIGTLIPRKAVEILIRCLKEASLSDFHLVLCGRTDEAAYMRQLHAEAAQVEGRVHFLGSIAPSEVAAALGLASYYVSASQFEGRPNSVLEALAAGKVVLASKIKEHGEIIKHAQNGFLFDSAASLAEQIATLEKDQALSKSIAKQASASVQSYSWQACAQAYTQVMRTVS